MKGLKFKNENAFKRWHCKYFFRNYKAYYTEIPSIAGFPDAYLSPNSPISNLCSVFCEYKFYKEQYDTNKIYKVKYQPLQKEILQNVANGGVPSFLVVGFYDIFIVTETIPVELSKETSATFNIYDYNDFASLDAISNEHLLNLGLKLES